MIYHAFSFQLAGQGQEELKVGQGKWKTHLPTGQVDLNGVFSSPVYSITNQLNLSRSSMNHSTSEHWPVTSPSSEVRFPAQHPNPHQTHTKPSECFPKGQAFHTKQTYEPLWSERSTVLHTCFIASFSFSRSIFLASLRRNSSSYFRISTLLLHSSTSTASGCTAWIVC